jgi:integrase/recombinase XerD
VFNDNEIVNMVKYWKGTTYTATKNKLMISLLIDTGIRVGELCSLLIENVEDDHIKVNGKGNKWRIVPISFQLRKLMMKYERKRKEVLEKNNKELDYYFFNQHKHKYESVSPIQKMIKYTAQKVKVRSSVRASPHSIRHYYAIKSLSLGTPITQLSKNLGHESIRTTEIYLSQITNEQVISEQMKKTVSPLSKI